MQFRFIGVPASFAAVVCIATFSGACAGSIEGWPDMAESEDEWPRPGEGTQTGADNGDEDVGKPAAAGESSAAADDGDENMLGLASISEA